MEYSFETKKYRNVFEEVGFSKEEIEKRKEEIFMTLFYGSEDEKIYHQAGDDMGYMEDTGNHDARTEGMSYGMMMCVQMDKKEEFDRLWKWAYTYMYMDKGANVGFFAWSCQTDGTKNAWGSAPDGEEFFAMALFFASHRWGDGEGIFNYSKMAKDLLHIMIHKGEEKKDTSSVKEHLYDMIYKEPVGRSMFDRDNKMIRFICEEDFSDPSYHLPHFYELFSMWAYEEDREFFSEAAVESRKYLKLACHKDTGLCAEYAYFDGTPYDKKRDIYNGRHDWFYSDSYRTIGNIALDYEWFKKDEWEKEIVGKYQKFFTETLSEENRYKVYEIDGTILDMDALHPVAMIATNAQASLARDDANSKYWVEKFFNTPLRTGDRRYYDNCLYFFAFLALSGNYRIY